MDKKASLLLIIIVSAMTFIFIVSGIIIPDRDYDEYENRRLITVDDLENSTYNELPQKIDEYFTEQFPLRRTMVKFYNDMLILEGKYYIRDLYIKNGWLIPRDYALNDSDITKAADNINSLAESLPPNKKLYYICVPQKAYVFGYMLPYPELTHHENVDKFAKLLDKGISFINAAKVMDSLSIDQKESMFFKTDFHWNGRGAFYAFELLINNMITNGDLPSGIYSEDDFEEWIIYDKQYKGDLNRRLAYKYSMNEEIVYMDYKDSLPLSYRLSVDGNFVDVNEDQVFASGIKSDIVEYVDVYTHNMAYYEIFSPRSLTDKRILILKDSMQNPTCKNFATIFRNTEIIDVRYLENISAKNLIEKSDADYVVIFYNSSNIVGEMSDFN